MKVLIVIDTYFPYGAAISSRIRNFCSLFASLGHRVHVICAYSKDIDENSTGIYNGCSFESVFKGNPSSIESFIGNPKLINRVKRYLRNNKVDLLMSNACPTYFLRLSKIAKRHNVTYIIEQCEWFDITSYTFRKLDPRYLKDNYLRNHGYKKADGIIAISKLLYKHYSALKIPSLRIPTILDIDNSKYMLSTNNKKIIIVYTGNCGVSKEYLKPIIEALADNVDLAEKIEFHIYGPDMKTVLQNIGNDEDLLNRTQFCAFIHGKVPQEEIEDVLIKANYQIFLRPIRNSSSAGFPTKLGESMAAGTPVITNFTGDIGLYLMDGINGFGVDSCSTDKVVDILKKIITIDQKQYSDMRRQARITAEKAFNINSYKDQLEEFIVSLRESKVKNEY